MNFRATCALLFTKGNDALQRDNLDYAIDLFNQVLAKEPGLYECRKVLRTAQLRKTGSGGGFFKKKLNSARSSPQVARGHMALSKDPAEALKIAEQILNNDPATRARINWSWKPRPPWGCSKTAVLSLEILAANSPKDRDVAIKFANAVAEAGEVGRRRKSWRTCIALSRPTMNCASAERPLGPQDPGRGRLRSPGGRTGSYRDILEGQREAVSLEQQNRQVKSEDVAERLINDTRRGCRRTQESEAAAFTGGVIHAEKAV